MKQPNKTIEKIFNVGDIVSVFINTNFSRPKKELATVVEIKERTLIVNIKGMSVRVPKNQVSNIN